MNVRRGPAVVLTTLVLSAAALSGAPALAEDGGAAKDAARESARDDVDRDKCDRSTATRSRFRVERISGNNFRVQVIGVVFSDDTDVWDWKIRRNGDDVFDGRARGREDSDLAFRVSRIMVDFPGADDVVFRAENMRTGEVCRTAISF